MDYIRENQQLVLKDGKLTFEKIELDCKLDEKSVLIRCCFTLTGFKPDLSIFNVLIAEDNKNEHFGYVSVVIVEECGINCNIVNKGDVIIMPATYSKYKILSQEDIICYSKVLMKRFPSNYDKVQILFYPFYCVAFQLHENISTNCKNIVFLSNSTVYKILLLLAIQSNLNTVIYGYEGVKQFLFDNDISQEQIIIVKKKQDFIEAMRNSEKVGFCFIQNEKELEEIEANIGDDCDVYKHDVKEIDNGNEPWKSFYIQEETIRAFGQLNINFSSFIAQHTHAEYVDQTLYHIKNGTYKDKLIVYDW